MLEKGMFRYEKFFDFYAFRIKFMESVKDLVTADCTTICTGRKLDNGIMCGSSCHVIISVQ